MVKSLPAEALDQVIATALTPYLRENGFRRTRMHWCSDTEGAWRMVSVQSHRFKAAGHIYFTVNLGVSYERFGDAAPRAAWECRIWRRIGHLPGGGDRDVWFDCDASDTNAVDAIAAALGESWKAAAVPFLDVGTDPASTGRYLLSKPNAPLADVLDRLAVPLGDVSLQQEVLAHASTMLASRGDQSPAAWNFMLRTKQLLGLSLTESERSAALDALDAARPLLASGEQSAEDEEDALLLAANLGVGAPEIGEKAPAPKSDPESVKSLLKTIADLKAAGKLGRIGGGPEGTS